MVLSVYYLNLTKAILVAFRKELIMYVISCKSGSYDDCWVSNHFYTRSLAEGQKYVDDKNLFAKNVKIARDKLQAFKIEYAKINPRIADITKQEWDKKFYLCFTEYMKFFSPEIATGIEDDVDDDYWDIDKVIKLISIKEKVL